MRSSADTPEVELVGLPLAALTRAEVLDRLEKALIGGRGGWLITANLDHLQRVASDASLARLYRRADYVLADGMPLLWASRLQGTPLPERVAGSDLVELVAERAARCGFSLYLLGGAPGAAEGAARRLRERFPALRIAGLSSPVISAEPTPAEIDATRDELERACPDVVYVGLGSPKQERLIAALRSDLPRIWWMGVGVSLSFLAGDVRRAPEWMQRLGIEWMHRLVQEPGRLWYRYVVVNIPFAVRLLVRGILARR